MVRTLGLMLGVLITWPTLVSAQSVPDVCASSREKPGYMLIMGGSENRAALSEIQTKNLQQYGRDVGALIATYGAKYVARSRPTAAIEGVWPAWKGVVISEWPCREAGQAFWHSDQYQNNVIPLRKGAATYRVAMFGAVAANPKQTGEWTAEGGAKAKYMACAAPVYLLVTAETKNAGMLRAYRQALSASGLMYGYGAVDILQGEPAEVLEGDWPKTFSAKVTRWPCREAFDAFYASAEYNTKYKPVRTGAADFTAVLVGAEHARR
jgi:uncharacterized protein (DUF1330 family)